MIASLSAVDPAVAGLTSDELRRTSKIRPGPDLPIKKTPTLEPDPEAELYNQNSWNHGTLEAVEPEPWNRWNAWNRQA